MKTLDLSTTTKEDTDGFEIMCDRGGWELAWTSTLAKEKMFVRLQRMAVGTGYEYFIGQDEYGEHTLYRKKVS